jgi:hypothetical protein
VIDKGKMFTCRKIKDDLPGHIFSRSKTTDIWVTAFSTSLENEELPSNLAMI